MLCAFHKDGRPLDEARHLEISMPGKGVQVRCPDVCNRSFDLPSRMRQYFGSAHFEHTLFIPEQEKVPRCCSCDQTGKDMRSAKHCATKWCENKAFCVNDT